MKSIDLVVEYLRLEDEGRPVFEPGGPATLAEVSARRLAHGSGPRQVEFLRPKHAEPQDLDSLTPLEGVVSGTSLLAQVVLD